MKVGLTHIYCGDGKGKTTAAIGLAVRCAGGGGKVLFYQFMKGNKSSERALLESSENITLINGKENQKFVWNMNEEEKHLSRNLYTEEFKRITQIAETEKYDLLILDELLSAVSCGFVPLKIVTDFLKLKSVTLEVVITGRNPNSELIALADYVSEIKKVKHPFDKNISARHLIEF